MGDSGAEKTEPAEASRGTCPIIVEFALLHHVPVAERARKGMLLGDPKEATEKFGPLKVVLGTIPAAYANREVRS